MQIVVLSVLAGLSVLSMALIAVAQLYYGKPIAIPPELSTLAGVAFAALYGHVSNVLQNNPSSTVTVTPPTSSVSVTPPKV